MIPREHLPLTLVTVALLGMLFLLFREVNALKAAVAQASVPKPARQLPPSASSKPEKPPAKGADDDEEEDDDDDELGDEFQNKDPQKPSPSTIQRKVNSSSEKSSAIASR